MSNVLVSALLSELPAGWSWQSLGDVLKVRNGFAFKSSDYQESGVLLIRQSNLGGNRVSLDKAEYLPEKFLKEHKDFRIKKGDVLIGMSGSIGKLCVYDRDEPALQNQRTGLLQFKDDSLKSWIWHYLPLIENKLHEGGKGIGVQNISASQIEALPIPIAPKEHRVHIVAEIEKQFSRLDDAVANLKRVKANLKRYKAAVLKAAVEGKLTEDWRRHHPDVEPASKLLERVLTEHRVKWNGRGKYREPAKPDTINLPPLPKHWTYAPVGAFLIEPMCNGISVKGSMTPPGVPALRLNAMTETGFDYSKVRYIPIDAALARELEVKTGDFFVSRGNGSLRLVGRGTVAQTPPRQCVFPDTMIRLRVAGAMGASRWISTIWSAELIRRQIEKRVKTTAGIWKISQPELGSILLPVPPEAEQHRIVAEVERRLSVIEELEGVVEANLKRAERLRHSILASAFAGKICSGELVRCTRVSEESINVSA